MASEPKPVRVVTETLVHGKEREALGVGPHDPLAALCLSGGGIRSAPFCLGTLQALARHKLLTEFHYLSTVSGGGYVGGWLTRWICATAERDADGRQEGASVVVSHLSRTVEIEVDRPG